ncbi:MAG: HutD family protein [Xanthomonadaceae bacterium]|nr:HutD family protein [Xanthomonadaceae bacterium]
MIPTLIFEDFYTAQPWRNGAGLAREILQLRCAPCSPEAVPADATPAESWDARISLADIEADSAFSIFPGVKRYQVLLSGEGHALTFVDGSSQNILPPRGRAVFSGDTPTQCRLIDGPVTVFNLMVRADRLHAELLHRPLVGSMLFFPEPGVTWVGYLMSGSAHFHGEPDARHLSAGDSFLLRSEPGPHPPQRAVLDGGGELLLTRFRQLK